LEQVEAVLAAYAELLPRLTPPLLGFAKANYDDLRAQLAGLVFPGFARAFTRERMAELPRYLTATRLRAERLQADPRRDQARMLEVQAFDAAQRVMAQDPRRAARAERLRWLIEEYRVQLFAQELKTREPVSDKRLRKLIEGDDA
jgi:ATP-dependent helicase HrpA